MVHQRKAAGVGVGALEDMMRGVRVCLFTPLASALVKVDGQRADCLGENTNTRPHRREVERALFGDVAVCRIVGNGVGEESLIDRLLELGGGNATLPPAF